MANRFCTASNTAAQAGSPPATAVSSAELRFGVAPGSAAGGVGVGAQVARSARRQRSDSTIQPRVRRGTPPPTRTISHRSASGGIDPAKLAAPSAAAGASGEVVPVRPSGIAQCR